MQLEAGQHELCLSFVMRMVRASTSLREGRASPLQTRRQEGESQQGQVYEAHEQ